MSALAIVLVLAAGPASRPAAASKPVPRDPVQELLDTGSLEGAYNPVLLDYLTDEGRAKLPDKQRQAALAQLVAGFRRQSQIKPGAQVAAGLATALGAVIGGAAGQGLSEGAARVWTEWVDGAFVLQKAGYKTEAAAFFENCVQNFPDDSLRGRCAVGLALVEPEKAFGVVLGLLGNEYPEEVQQAALRALGAMAASDALPQVQKDRAVEELIKRTKGLSSASLGGAAIDGLALSKDPRAVEPLRKMTKGMLGAPEHKRAAKRALLLVFGDAEALQALQKDVKGGFMKQPEEQVAAALVLIEAGQAAGFDFALEYLAKGKKKDPDFSGELVDALLAKSGDPARDVLSRAFPAQKKGEWLQATMAIGLLRLGDESHLDVVRSALANKDWLYTRLEAAVALAERKDYSGVPVLRALTENVGLLKSALDAAKGRYRDPEAVRAAVAGALGRIDTADAAAVLTALLADKSEGVRLAAAYALASMRDPAALDGLARALETDYGKEDGRSRNPELHAYLLRATAARFPKDPKTAALLEKGTQSQAVSVRFLALAAAR